MDHNECKCKFTQTGLQRIVANSGLRPHNQLMLLACLKEVQSPAKQHGDLDEMC